MIVDNWDLKSVIAISCNGDINGLPLWSSNVAIIELSGGSHDSCSEDKHQT